MATEIETRTCPRCGTENDSGARFCSNCGLSLGEAPRAERRIVTVLFGDLSGFTEMSERLDAEEVKSIVDRAFEGLAELVTLYGGRVDKIIGDEIMAVFGAPQTHEDDPERAVRCALEMQRQLGAYSRQLERERGVKLAMRIGVNTGEVVAGVAGGADAYTVIGDAVNAAKRIEGATHGGQILVGERTYLGTAAAIEYRSHDPIVAKGKSEPLAVWEAVAERALPGEHIHRLEAPIIGRDEELHIMESLAEIVRRDKRAAVVTILGPAGMGKSRLADEFGRRIASQGVRIIAGRSLPYGTASPSFAVEEMVRSALDVEAGELPGVARAKAGERIAELGLLADADRLLSIAGLREPVGVRETGGGGGIGPAAGSSVPARGGEALQSAVALFQEVASREDLIVLAFHELHWAEDSLLEFVSDLAERGRDSPMLILCLARPELADRRPGWTGRPGSLVHALEPLPRDRAAHLLDVLAGQRAIHPAVRESILERAGGNPFFIEELVRLLLDQGGLPTTDALDAAGAVPGTVQALVSARLDALPADAKRVAQTAAVVGEEFWAGALAGLEPDLGAAGVDRALARLSEAELIEPIEHPSVPGERAFRFRQAIVREVAYASVPKQVRAQAHAALGSWLEEVTREGDLLGEFADLVAHHYERAARLAAEVGIDMREAREKAREYLERAGDQAIGHDAAAAAADFFERALEYARDDADRLHIQLHLGEALVGCWRPVEAERHLNEARETARRLGDRKAEGKGLRLLGDLMRMRGDVDDGRKLLEQGLEIAREVGDRREEAEGLRSHGLSDLFAGRLDAAPIWFRQSLARFRELGDRRGEGWNLVNLAWVDLLLGRLDEAMSFLEEGASIFGELGDAEGLGWCMGLRAWVLLFQGKLSEAEAIQRQIDSMIVQAMRPTPRGMGSFGWAIGRACLALIALDRAHMAEAEEYARQGLEVFEESDAVWGLAMARFPLGVSQMARLLLDEARETFRQARQVAERSSDPMVRSLVTHGAAMVEFELGNLDAAWELDEESLRLTAGSGVSWISETPGRALKAAILRERGKSSEARRVLEEHSGGQAGLYEEARAIALLAEVICDEGKPKDAIEVARRGIAAAGEDACGSAWCHRALARAHHLAGEHEEAERVLRAELELLADGDWDEERVQIWALLAGVYDELGRHDEAGLAIDQARALILRFPATAHTQKLERLLGT
jgi:class 3 adenylate cyclase/tetratricopeptide (TPR) repeat protein